MNAKEPDLGAWRIFAQDLIRALGAWRDAPFLPVASVLITLGSSAVERATTTASAPLMVGSVILVSVVIAGWFGTERIWYLRVYRGKRIHLVELFPLTGAFAFRFAKLGLLIFGPLSIVFTVMTFWLARSSFVGHQPLSIESVANTMVLVSFLVYVPIDVFLTFVTPALAYSTRGVLKALGIGWRMLRDEWPKSAGYALVPPLAVLISLQTLPESALGRIGSLMLSGAAVLLNLWFKGATAAFYLRRHDVGDTGAAFNPSSVARS